MLTDRRIAVEFLVEPFVEGAPGPHVAAALASIERDGLAVEVGPFSTEVRGSLVAVADGVREVIIAAMEHGATRIQLHVAGAASEDLHGALDRLVATVEHELGAPLPDLPREGKQAAVRLLAERGAFLLRRSVEDVAELMGVSRITIYNYLNAIGERHDG
jgi:uncharacterized protein YqgV (UPF0045/DUF77 family)